MAIKILTVEQAKKTKDLAQKFGELYAELKGKALSDLICDFSGQEIKQGSECVVVALCNEHQQDIFEENKQRLYMYVG